MLYPIVEEFLKEFASKTTGFTFRPEQAKYMSAFLPLFYVDTNKQDDTISKIFAEAGTGTGKTIGYLMAYNLVKNYPDKAVPLVTQLLEKEAFDKRFFLESDISNVDIDYSKDNVFVYPQVSNLFITASSKMLQAQIINTINVINEFNQKMQKPQIKFATIVGKSNYVCQNHITTLLDFFTNNNKGVSLDAKLFTTEGINKSMFLTFLNALAQSEVSTTEEAKDLVSKTQGIEEFVEHPITKRKVPFFDAFTKTLDYLRNSQELTSLPSLSAPGLKFVRANSGGAFFESYCSVCKMPNCEKYQDLQKVGEADVIIMNHHSFIHTFRNVMRAFSSERASLSKEIEDFRKTYGCNPFSSQEKIKNHLYEHPEILGNVLLQEELINAILHRAETIKQTQKLYNNIQTIHIDNKKINFSESLMVIDEAHDLPKVLLGIDSTSIKLPEIYVLLRDLEEKVSRLPKSSKDAKFIEFNKKFVDYVSEFGKAIENMDYLLREYAEAIDKNEEPEYDANNMRFADFTSLIKHQDPNVSPKNKIEALVTFINETESLLNDLESYNIWGVSNKLYHLRSIQKIALIEFQALRRDYIQELLVSGKDKIDITREELEFLNDSLRELYQKYKLFHGNKLFTTTPDMSTDLSITAPPLNTEGMMDRFFFSQWKNMRVMLTSGTLLPCTEQPYKDFLKQLSISPNQASWIRLESPFTLEQSKIVHFGDVPAIDATATEYSPEWEEYLLKKIPEVIFETKGGALILSPKIALSSKIYKHLLSIKDELGEKHGVHLYIAGHFTKKMELIELAEKCKNDPRAKFIAIQGHDGFQGLDIRGLTSVHILKLPYEHPSSPLGREIDQKATARVVTALSNYPAGAEGTLSKETIEALYNNSRRAIWKSYGIAWAANSFRQQMGRLIRSSEDKGVIYLYDNYNRIKRFVSQITNPKKVALPVKLPKIITYDTLEYKKFIDEVNTTYAYHPTAISIQEIENDNNLSGLNGKKK